jgi:hypothetical protein
MDKGAALLPKLGCLKRLYLQGTSITDRGVEKIAACRGLVELHLSFTAVTDEGLKPLEQLKGLRELYLIQTDRVSADAVNHLRSYHHGIRIYRSLFEDGK